MKRKCHATGPHHDDPCNGGRVQCPNAQFTQDCDHCHGTGEVEDHRASTAITPDGLRGLGFDVCDGVFFLPLGGDELETFYHKAIDGWRVELACSRLGTAPDLEWVAAMIGLLKRANGEGV